LRRCRPAAARPAVAGGRNGTAAVRADGRRSFNQPTGRGQSPQAAGIRETSTKAGCSIAHTKHSCRPQPALGVRLMKRTAVAGLLVLFLAVGASADDKPAGKKPGGKGGAGNGQMLQKLFEKADVNGDGKVSLA